jgi:CheY-like chemotaxis protein
MSTTELSAEAANQGRTAPTGGNNAPTILIVDDAASCREMVARSLTAQGFNVRVAADGPAAIAILGSAPVSLMILDLKMPGMDGMEVLRIARSDPRWQKLPIIMLTSTSDKPAITEGLKNGIAGYLLKSGISLTDLNGRIRLALGLAPPASKSAQAHELLNRVRAAIGVVPVPGPAPAASPAPEAGGRSEAPRAARGGPSAAPPPARSSTAAPPHLTAPLHINAPTHNSAPPHMTAALHVTTPPHVNTAPPQVTAAPPHVSAPLPVAAPPPITAPNLVTRDATLAAILEMSTARTLAGIVTSVAEICGGAKVSFNELGATIKQDPVLSARVVQLVNAGAGKNKAKLVTIEDAIRSAGPEAIANLASTVGMLTSFEQGKADGLDLLRSWQHAIATATVMAKIVPQTDKIGAGLPHLVGLSHDLTEILLRQRFPTEFATAADHAAKAGRPIRDLIEAVFGISHRELTKCLLAELKFPAEVADPINEFNRHAGETIDACSGLMSRSLAIATAYVDGIMLSSSLFEKVSPVAMTDCRTVLIKTEALNMAEVRSEAIGGTCMLAKLSADQEAVALRPLLKSEAKIWYARHNSFAPLDPLEAALTHLCNVSAHDRMPTPIESSSVGGIVIAAPGHNNALVSEVNKLRSSRSADKPILHLVAAGGPAPLTRHGVEELTFPITLERLTKFVATVKVGDS